MHTIREAAGAFIEAGRALGRSTALSDVHARLLYAIERGDISTNVTSLSASLREEVERVAQESAEYSLAAERLMEELERPGARLGQRLLLAWDAARDAWQASRYAR
jgi:hypothetical protein